MSLALLVGLSSCSDGPPATSAPGEARADHEASAGLDVLILSIHKYGRGDLAVPELAGKGNNNYGDRWAGKLRDWYEQTWRRGHGLGAEDPIPEGLHRPTIQVVSIADDPQEPHQGPQRLFELLRQLHADRVQFDRIVIFAHGNSDGPVFCCAENNSPQVGRDWPENYQLFSKNNVDALKELGQLFHDVTRPTSWIYLASCDPAQTSHFPGFATYLDVLSCVSGRTSYGVAAQVPYPKSYEYVIGLEGENHAPPGAVVRKDPCEVHNQGLLIGGDDQPLVCPDREELSCPGQPARP
jgi:hypothetical protein